MKLALVKMVVTADVWLDDKKEIEHIEDIREVGEFEIIEEWER